MFDPIHDIDWTRTSPMGQFAGESLESFQERQSLVVQAEEVLYSRKRFRALVRVRWGHDSLNTLAALLCEVDMGPDINFESYLWVIVGDTSPMIISTRRCRNVYQAFAHYCDRSREWIARNLNGPDAFRSELAELLSRRVSLIERHVVEPNRWLLAAPTAHDRA